MCARALRAQQSEFYLHGQQVLGPEWGKTSIYPKRSGEGKVTSGTSNVGGQPMEVEIPCIPQILTFSSAGLKNKTLLKGKSLEKRNQSREQLQGVL